MLYLELREEKKKRKVDQFKDNNPWRPLVIKEMDDCRLFANLLNNKYTITI